MKQIGEVAGVSQSTVSRVLGGAQGARIAARTRQRVLAVVQELGYSPNPLARGLRGARTALIGLIVREVSDPFFATLIERIAVEARMRSHSVLLGYAHSQADDAVELTWVLETGHCDGLLLLGDLHDQPRLLERLAEPHRPMLALCVGTRATAVPAINTDNAAGAQMALEHLWALGHRRIAFLDAGWLGDVIERRERYAAFLTEHQLPHPASYIRVAENSLRGGYAALRTLLRLSAPPSAVFAATDRLAAGAVKAALDAGLRVPHDLSLIGFDDSPIAEFTTPGLTTVRQPITEMAALAVSELLSMVGGGPAEPTVRRLPPILVVRDSTAPPATANKP